MNFYARLLGYEVPLNVFDKGLHIFHSGSLVVNGQCQVGKNCKIIGSACLGGKNGGGGPKIGDNCELGMFSVVIGKIEIGNNVKIGAGAVVTKPFLEDNLSLVGVPAHKL